MCCSCDIRISYIRVYVCLWNINLDRWNERVSGHMCDVQLQHWCNCKLNYHRRKYLKGKLQNITKLLNTCNSQLDDKLSPHQHGSYNTCVLCMYVCVYRSGKLGLFSTARNVPRKVRNQKIWFPNSSLDWSFFAFTPLKYESLIFFF